MPKNVLEGKEKVVTNCPLLHWSDCIRWVAFNSVRKFWRVWKAGPSAEENNSQWGSCQCSVRSGEDRGRNWGWASNVGGLSEASTSQESVLKCWVTRVLMEECAVCTQSQQVAGPRLGEWPSGVLGAQHGWPQRVIMPVPPSPQGKLLRPLQPHPEPDGRCGGRRVCYPLSCSRISTSPSVFLARASSCDHPWPLGG